MDGPEIQEKIYYGYGKAATHLGLTYTIYRSIDGLDPIKPENIVGEVKLSPTVAWSYMVPKKYGDNTWILVVDGRVIQPGDYLVGPVRTFFVASLEHLMPILGVMCDRQITIVRPKSPDGVGDVGYSGYVNKDVATGDTLYTNVPASFLKSSRGERNPVKLPTSAKMPWYAVFLPALGSVFLRNGDIITDDANQQFVISDNEHTHLGWHLNVHGLEA